MYLFKNNCNCVNNKPRPQHVTRYSQSYVLVIRRTLKSGLQGALWTKTAPTTHGQQFITAVRAISVGVHRLPAIMVTICSCRHSAGGPTSLSPSFRNDPPLTFPHSIPFHDRAHDICASPQICRAAHIQPTHLSNKHSSR